jgi:hypothetical protein
MKFQEIDLTFDLISGGIPIEIKSIFKHEFHDGKLYNRYQKLSGENYLSFTPYGDYWEFIDDWKGYKVFGENGKPIEDIIPYYEAYSKGFMDGYFEFEIEIKEFSQIFFQNSFPTEKIFDEIKSTPMPFSSRGYYYPNDDFKQKAIPVLNKSLLAADGKKIGRNYKAWFYILKNPKPFIPLFRSFYSESFKFYEEEYRKWNAHHEGYISSLQIVIDEIQAKETSQSNLNENKINPLESIWMKDPKKTIEQVIEKGFGLGLWDEKNRLQSKKGGVYGSGKDLLSGLYFSLKGNSIKENIDHKEVGKVLCEFFDVAINPNTKEPFKPFNSKNENITREFQKTLRLL